ncbi:MAG: AI-2E family transporter [Candidatus Saccharimonadales bacterium]
MFRLLRNKANPEELELRVSNRTVLRVIGLVVVAIVLLMAIRRSAHTLTWIGVAFFLALALNAPVHLLAAHLPGRTRGSRSVATTISVLVVILAFLGFLAAVVPPLAKQTTTFIQATPHLIEEVRSQDSGVGKFVRKYKLQDQVDKVSKQLSGRFSNATDTAAGAISKIGSSIFASLTIIVLTFMMLVEGPRWGKIVTMMIPDKHQDHAISIAKDMYKVVKGYVNGQVLLAAIASLLIVPMLFILHISYPWALMVIVFICGLIPMVGHTIGAIIVTIVALFHSVPTAIIILAYYILYQQIENYAVQPKIQANSTNMSPLLVFTAVILGVNFGGLLGGLVAIPVMGCLRIVVLDYLDHKDILTKKERISVTAETK